MLNSNDFQISLPDWAVAELQALPARIDSIEERMAIVIRFSALNIQHDTGGPFAAGVFNEETGELVTVGVNRVVPSNCSSAHAEVVALSLAQKKLQTFDLGGKDLPRHQLVVNWRPCAMCYGAVVWSGVRSLVIAGSDGQLEQITGFDEGPIHPDWMAELQRRGICVTDNVLKDDACNVFRTFRESGKLVYNGRRSD
ncbi:MAG: nucleoside deaminase [Planctomycetaceae bacterium]